VWPPPWLQPACTAPQSFSDAIIPSLQDIWELPNRVAEALIDTKSPLLTNETMTLWELGNTYIMSAREVMANNDRMANSSLPTANVTTDMQLNRHWHFVAANGPGSLFEAYKGMMDALVTRAMGQVKQVSLATRTTVLLFGDACDPLGLTQTPRTLCAG
jgi:hypothetical protein